MNLFKAAEAMLVACQMPASDQRDSAIAYAAIDLLAAVRSERADDTALLKRCLAYIDGPQNDQAESAQLEASLRARLGVTG